MDTTPRTTLGSTMHLLRRIAPFLTRDRLDRLLATVAVSVVVLALSPTGRVIALIVLGVIGAASILWHLPQPQATMHLLRRRIASSFTRDRLDRRRRIASSFTRDRLDRFVMVITVNRD